MSRKHNENKFENIAMYDNVLRSIVLEDKNVCSKGFKTRCFYSTADKLDPAYITPTLVIIATLWQVNHRSGFSLIGVVARQASLEVVMRC
jgi:hypothetical protein